MLTEKQIWDLNKADQEKILHSYGFTEQNVKQLNTEEKRVKKIMELQGTAPAQVQAKPVQTAHAEPVIKKNAKYTEDGQEIIAEVTPEEIVVEMPANLVNNRTPEKPGIIVKDRNGFLSVRVK